MLAPSTPARLLVDSSSVHGKPRGKERELNIERTRAVLDVARLLGRKGGRKRKMTDGKIEYAKKLLASGVPVKDVAKNFCLNLPTPERGAVCLL